MDCEAGKSRIPSLRRSASVRVRGERFVPNSGPCCHGPHSSGQGMAPPDSHNCHQSCGDNESLQSRGSTTSLASCGSVQQARDKGSYSNGRSNKFVLHCQRHLEAPQDTYLTPTQRKDRELRNLRAALSRAMRDAQEKSEQLQVLSLEMERLRQGRPLTPHNEEGSSQNEGSTADGDDREDSGVVVGDLVIERNDRYTSEYLPKEVQTDEVARCESSVSTAAQASDMDDGILLSMLSGGMVTEHQEDTVGDTGAQKGHRKSLGSIMSAELDMKDECTQDVEDTEVLKRKYRELKQRYNDRTENLLQMLSDLNVKYLELRPAYDGMQERMRQLERQLTDARQEIERQEQWHSEMYLKMYRKGQEAARFEHSEDGLLDTVDPPAPGRPGSLPGGGIPQLLQQLRRTELELERARDLYRSPPPQLPAIRAGPGDRQAEYTLRFLKDAVFYFLTDRTDCRGHLNAIQSILGFSETERAAVAKAWRNRGRL